MVTKKKSAAKKTVKKSTGRSKPVLQFRMKADLYAKLKSAAHDNLSSISEEAAERLAISLGQRERFPGVEPIAMSIAGLFWQAGQYYSGNKDYTSSDWMNDPEIYRRAFAVAFSVFADLSMPIKTDDEKERLCKAFCTNLLDRDFE